MKNLGFFLLHIDAAVSSTILENINSLNHCLDKKLIIFNSYNSSSNYNIPIMHINQSKFFSGDVVVFDIISLLIANSCYKIRNIYYYAYNIPWMIDQKTDYKFWSELFDNPKVQIIAQNQQIYNIFNTVWKTPVTISEEISSHEFIKIIR